MITQLPPRQDVLARRDAIVAGLRRLLPPDAVIAEPLLLKPYETDGLTAYRQVPLAVVLPETTAQVAAVMAFLHREGVRVVPRGAGTSLSGGALPMEDAVVLGLMRHEPHPGNRLRRPARRGAGRGDQYRHHPGGAGAAGSSTPPTRPASSPA